MKRHESLAGQLLAFDEHSGLVRCLLLHLIQHEWDAICSEARMRLREGYLDFGHEGWEKPLDGLWQDLSEELADAANYAAMIYEQKGVESCRHPRASSYSSLPSS